MAKNETFVSSVVNAGKKSGGITHPIESNGPKRKRAGFYGYAMGSAMSDIPANDAAAGADAAYAQCGGYDAGGAACGESIDLDTFKACLEASMPKSELADQINSLFTTMRNGKTNTALYSGADGMEHVSDDSDDPVRDNVISAAAAACESALKTFKLIAGVDYWNFRR